MERRPFQGQRKQLEEELTRIGQSLVLASDVKVGDVKGPYLEGGEYKLIKITGIAEGEKEFVRASHILLQPTGNTKADTLKAIAEAKALIKTLKTDADFEKAARDLALRRIWSAAVGEADGAGDRRQETGDRRREQPTSL